MEWLLNKLIEFFTTSDKSLDITKLMITQIVIIVAAASSLFLGLRNDQRVKKNTFINTITSNRIDWMQEFKKIINDYITSTQLGTNARVFTNDKDKIEYFDSLLRKKNEIVFHLNFQGYLDKQIIENISAIYKNMELIYEINEFHKEKDINERMKYFLKHYNMDIFSEIKDLIDSDVQKFKELKSAALNDKDIPEFVDKVIYDKLTKFNEYYSRLPRRILISMEGLHNRLIQLSQVYLKLEWNRVKRESKGNMRSEWKWYYKNKADEMLQMNELKTIDYNHNKLPAYIRVEENKNFKV